MKVQFRALSSALLTIVSLGVFFGVRVAQAQQAMYPSKPIHIVVPASPGGVTDILARALGQRFTETWGYQSIVENKAGANNMIAAEYVAKSAPDGYTLFLAPEVTFVVNPVIYSKLPYDAANDFAPITGLVRINHALIANPALPAASVKELIELAKAKPGDLSYGSFGLGSSGHLNMEMLQNMTGAQFNHVQYKGATPALIDVAAGHLAMMFISTGSAVPQWKAGKVKWIAVGSAKRLPQYPNIPTVAESGLPGFEAVSWFGLFAVAKTSPEIIARIYVEVQRMFSDPAFTEKFVAPQLFESIVSSPEQFARFIKAEEQKWAKVIRTAKIKVD